MRSLIVGRKLLLTFVAGYYCSKRVANLTTRVQIRNLINIWLGLWTAKCRWGCTIPLRSVDTPVAYNPLDATAREPPRSTLKRDEMSALDVGHQNAWYLPMLAIVPPCIIFSRFYRRGNKLFEQGRCVSQRKLTVCSFRMSSSKSTRPGSAAVTRS